MKKLSLILPVLLLAACGSPNTFEGTVAGHSFEPVDAVWVKIDDPRAEFNALLLSDVPDICAVIKSGREPKNATMFMAILVRGDFSGEEPKWLPIDAADYSVVNPAADLTGLPARYSMTEFQKADSECKDTINESSAGGVSGLITVESLPTPHSPATGKFDITFGSQNDKVKGTFSAALCDLGSAGFGSNCE